MITTEQDLTLNIPFPLLNSPEPDVASSDATNISCSIVRNGSEYVVNGRKWWSSGAGDPRCKLAIVLGKTFGSDTPKCASVLTCLLKSPLCVQRKKKTRMEWNGDLSLNVFFRHLRLFILGCL